MEITDYWKIQNDDFNKIEITCYICGIDLMKEYKKETSQQNDLEEAIQKFPAMVTLYGIRKELCGSCYKSHKSGMDVYQEVLILNGNILKSVDDKYCEINEIRT